MCLLECFLKLNMHSLISFKVIFFHTSSIFFWSSWELAECQSFILDLRICHTFSIELRLVISCEIFDVWLECFFSDLYVDCFRMWDWVLRDTPVIFWICLAGVSFFCICFTEALWDVSHSLESTGSEHTEVVSLWVIMVVVLRSKECARQRGCERDSLNQPQLLSPTLSLS